MEEQRLIHSHWLCNDDTNKVYNTQFHRTVANTMADEDIDFDCYHTFNNGHEL